MSKGVNLNDLLDQNKQEEIPKTIPIKLMKCLQHGSHKFEEIPGTIYSHLVETVVHITRIKDHSQLDVILLKYRSGNDQVWLGKWNDGVW